MAVHLMRSDSEWFWALYIQCTEWDWWYVVEWQWRGWECWEWVWMNLKALTVKMNTVTLTG